MSQGVHLRSDPYRQVAQLPVQIVQLLYGSDGTDDTNYLSALNVDDVSDDPDCEEELGEAETLLQQGEDNLARNSSEKRQTPTGYTRTMMSRVGIISALVGVVSLIRSHKTVWTGFSLAAWYCLAWRFDLIDLDNATERTTWKTAAKTAKLVDLPDLTKRKYVYRHQKYPQGIVDIIGKKQPMTMKDIVRYDLCDPNVKRSHKPAFYVCMDKLSRIATFVSQAHDRNVASIRKKCVDGTRSIEELDSLLAQPGVTPANEESSNANKAIKQQSLIEERDSLLARANEQFAKANRAIERQFIIIKNQ